MNVLQISFSACLQTKMGIIGTIYQERSRMSCFTKSLCLIFILMRCDHSISPGTIEDRQLPIKSLPVLSIHHRSMAQHDEASRTGHPRQGNIGGAVPSAGHSDHVNFDVPSKTCGRFIAPYQHEDIRTAGRIPFEYRQSNVRSRDALLSIHFE